jgi:hypothetical protein
MTPPVSAVPHGESFDVDTASLAHCNVSDQKAKPDHSLIPATPCIERGSSAERSTRYRARSQSREAAGPAAPNGTRIPYGLARAMCVQ